MSWWEWSVVVVGAWAGVALFLGLVLGPRLRAATGTGRGQVLPRVVTERPGVGQAAVAAVTNLVPSRRIPGSSA